MADHQIGAVASDLAIVDRRKTTSAGDQTQHFGTVANYSSISAMRTRLAAISGTAYSAARLNSMTPNDMIYALRLNDDATSI